MTSWEINAITFSTLDMGAAVRFWRTLDLDVAYGGPDSEFSTLRFGTNFINLQSDDRYAPHHWGRVVFHVESPDDVWRTFAEAGYRAMTEPANAPWGERYFHIKDPDGHELSFARPLTDDERRSTS